MDSHLRMKAPSIVLGMVAILFLTCPVFAAADPQPPPAPQSGDGKVTTEIVSKKSGGAVDTNKARAVLEDIAPPSGQRSTGSPESAVNYFDPCTDRFQSCTSYTIRVNQYQRAQDPAPVGWWFFDVTLVQISWWSYQASTMGSNATLTGFGGAPKPGSMILEYHGANGVFEANDPDTWDSPDIIGTHTVTASTAMLNEPQSDQYDWFPGIADEWDESTTLQMIITGAFPGYFPDAPQVSLTDNRIRCDQFASGTSVGCVNPLNQAQLTTMKQLPDIIANIRNQVANGAPTTLTRLTDETQIAANREALCPASRPRPPGQSCDEYPFAGSYEGGGANGVGGWAWVTESQNNAQGGYLSTFYQQKRILDGEPYEVDISN